MRFIEPLENNHNDSVKLRPGVIVFAHSNGIMGRVIRFGERLRWHGGHFFNHVAIIDRVEDGVAYLIQAEAKGVTNDKTLASVAPGGKYVLIEPPHDIDVDDMLAFARQEVGSQYGWLSIVSIALDIVLPLWFVAFRRPSTWICSALIAESMRAGGWRREWADVYVVTPAQLWLAIRGLFAD